MKQIRFVHGEFSASEIALSGLDRDVTKKELNLLQFAAGAAAEPSATPTLMPHAA